MKSCATLNADFAFNDHVTIDESDITGVVVAILFRPGSSTEMTAHSYIQYEVSWFSNGVKYSDWFDGFRLKRQDQ